MKTIIFFILSFLAVSFSNAQINSIAIVGNGVGGWPTGAAGEVDTNQMTSSDGVIWTIENLVTTNGAAKFRANNSWTNNWGGSAFPSGVAVSDGANIPTPIGVYNVTFNSTTLEYNFSASNIYPAISLNGPGVGGDNSDIDLGTTDGIHYSGNSISINGAVKFRQDQGSSGDSWEPVTFPSGTAVLNGTGTLDVPNNTYNVTFNLNTLEYAFNYVSVAIVGSGTPQGWPSDPQTDAHVMATTDGVHYVINSLQITTDAVKFRQDNSWNVQWGGDGGFPSGTGSQNGIDINVAAGVYSITLNRLTGAYNFGEPIGAASLPNCTLIQVSSTTASSGNAILATDGDSSTQWVSTSSDPQSITMDLGAENTVNAVTINWGINSAKHYFLRGSVDGNSWIDIAENNNMDYGARTDVINVDSQYRWLKIDGVSSNTENGYAIYEFNVCGTSIIDNAKHILFVGNSYTYYNAMPFMLKEVAASMGNELVVQSNTIGGTSLEAHFANPGTTGKIQQQNWDYVVLQEQSQRPALDDAYVEANVFPFATQLAAMTRQNSPCVDLFFYQTWGRENGDAANCPTIPEVCTYLGMDERLELRYNQMADDNDAMVSPVGRVRREIRALHPEIDLYVDDESHPTLVGSYVSAVTFNTVIYRTDPTLITYNSTLDETVANQVKTIVKSIVYNNFEEWNVGAYDPVAAFEYETTGSTVAFTSNSTNAVEYLWDFGDGTSSDAQNPEHDFTGDGPFEVTLTVINCDRQSTTTQMVTTLSIPDFSGQNFTVYPNPTQNIWTFISTNSNIVHIEVVDILGKTVLYVSPNSLDAQVDASKLSNGIYIAKVVSNNATASIRLLKK